MLDCTIVIPSRSRPDFFRRCLSFILESELNAPVIFVDNSDEEFTQHYLDIVSEFARTELELTYIRASGKQTFVAYLLEGFLAVKTSYCVFLSDDDLISLKFMSSAIDFLNQNPTYSSVTGQFVYFSIQDDVPYGPHKILRYAEGLESEDEHILSRILRNELRYELDLSTYLCFDHVRRTQDWIEIAKLMNECATYEIENSVRDEYAQANTFIDEYFMTPIALCSGKVKNLPMVNIAIQVHPKQQGSVILSDADIITAFESTKWYPLFNTYIDKATAYVSNKTGRSTSEIRKLLHTLAWSRFTHFVNKGTRNRYYQLMRQDFIPSAHHTRIADCHDPYILKFMVFIRRLLGKIEKRARRKQIESVSSISERKITANDKETMDKIFSYIKSPSTLS